MVFHQHIGEVPDFVGEFVYGFLKGFAPSYRLHLWTPRQVDALFRQPLHFYRESQGRLNRLNLTDDDLLDRDCRRFRNRHFAHLAKSGRKDDAIRGRDGAAIEEVDLAKGCFHVKVRQRRDAVFGDDDFEPP
jgi:hypothetical protein